MSVTVRATRNHSTSHVLKPALPYLSKQRTPWWWLRDIIKLYHFKMFSRVVPSDCIDLLRADWLDELPSLPSLFFLLLVSSLVVSSEVLHLSLLPHLLNFMKKGDWILTLPFTLCDECALSGLVSPFVVRRQWLLPSRATEWRPWCREPSDALCIKTENSSALTSLHCFW